MDKLIIMLLVIGWAVLKARRKALREQARKQEQPSRAEQPRRSSQSLRAAQSLRAPQTMQRGSQTIPQSARAMGAVTAEENRRPAEQMVERWAERAKEALGANEMPQEVRQMVLARQTAQPDLAEERVEEIVPVASEAPYEAAAQTKSRISLNKEALRTFMVTREILGPARFRNPHRLSIRSK